MEGTMKHLNLELEQLEERIATWAVPVGDCGTGSKGSKGSNHSGSKGSNHSGSKGSNHSGSKHSGSKGSKSC
jgi:hypothetical protein